MIMSASIAFRKKSLSMDFVKRTAGLISNAAGEYISESLPISTNTLKEAKATASKVSSTLATTSQEVLPKIRNIKSQNPMRAIYKWYMEKDNEFGDSSLDMELGFDTDIDASAIADVQIGEAEKNSNKIAKAVIDSSKQMVESQIAAVANIQNTLEKQTSVITAGFDRTNDTLNKILEVLTKNTASIIEATVAANSERNPANDMMRYGKFNATSYKKMVSANIKNSPEYSMISMLPMMLSFGFNPEDMVKGLFNAGLNKAAPNLKKNMKALDDMVNDTIMHSLIRLGNSARKNPFSAAGYIGKFFGIDSSRQNQSTSRDTLEVKSVSFDTITRESITNAIPGYLRKILVALGGDDVVYDYRSRSFKTKASIKKEFSRAGETGYSSMYSASSKVRSTLSKSGSSKTNDMLYELLLTKLGSESDMTKTLESFKNPRELEKYMNNLTKGIKMNAKERESMAAFMSGIYSLTGSNNGIMDIMMQASRSNVARNTKMSEYIANANLYNVDLSEFADSVENDLAGVLSKYGKKRKGASASAAPVDPKNMTGSMYTNAALYQIFKRLDTGINVFQVGSSTEQPLKFDEFGDKVLPPPAKYKPRKVKNPTRNTPFVKMGNITSGEDGPNLLENQVNEDGTVENLTTGQRVGRWAKSKGGRLRRAIWSGSPEEVRAAFGDIINDIGQTSSSFIKDQLAKINDNNGNLAGYLKHKLTGASYKYSKDGKEYEVQKNEKGGYLGYFNELLFGPGGYKEALKRTGKASSNWFKSIAGYFNYGSKDEDNDISNRRNKIIGVGGGAIIGMGMLGGPLGLILGGIAGNALAQTSGLGDKIHKFLFGDKEHEGDSKKDRNKRRGLIGRVVDNITDPIRYQVGKTMTAFAGVLKKNILGPLSNIGVAIKERMANAAGGVVSKTFGKIFGGMGNILKKLIMLPLDIARAPIALLGGAARGGAEAGGAVAGGFLNSIAKSIAGKEGRDVIKDRIRSQREDVAADKAGSGYYRRYKDWKKDQDESRDKMNLSDYTDEKVVEIQTDIADTAQQIADRQETLADKIEGEIIPGSSFKSHDQGIHDRLDDIISILTGKKSRRGSKVTTDTSSGNTAEFASSAIAAAASLSGSGDEVNNEESRVYGALIDESSKSNPNKGTIVQRLKEIMGLQKKKTDEKTATAEKKESIFEKITNTISSGFSLDGLADKIKTGIGAAIAGFFGVSEFKSLWDNVIKGDMDFSQWWGEESMIGQAWQAIKGISSSVGAVAIKIINPVSKALNTVIPMIPGLEEVPPIPEIKQDGVLGGMQAAILGGLYLKAASAIGSIGSGIAGMINAGSKAGSSIADVISNLFGSKGGKVSGIAQVATRAAAIALPAMAGYSLLTGGAEHENTDAAGNKIDDTATTNAMNSWFTGAGHTVFGMTESANPFYNKAVQQRAQNRMYNAAQTAAKYGGDATQAATTALQREAASGGLSASTVMSSNRVNKIVSSATNSIDEAADSGVITKAVNGLKTVLNKFFTFIKNHKSLSKVAGVVKYIDDVSMKVLKYINVDMFKPLASKVATIVAKVTGKEATSVATAGIGYAVFGILGAASGAASAANIFGVREQDVDAGMTTIASVIVAALNAIPMIGYIELVDLVLVPTIGTSFRQLICQGLYSLLGGSEALDEKQATFAGDVSHYNSTYGANLTTAEYNDMVNKGLVSKIFGKGGVKTDASGRAMFDDAGEVLRTNHGVAGWFAGGEKVYARGADGEILKTADGKAIQAIDAQGHKMVKNKTWTNHIGDWFHDVGSWFGGKVEYELDENGNVIYDENGEPVVKGKGKNVLQRAGDKLSQFGTSVVSWAKGVGSDVKDWATGIGASIKDFATGIGNTFTGMVDKVKGFGQRLSNEYEYAKTLLADKDSDFKDLFKIEEEDPDNPMGGFTKTAVIASRLAVIPAALFKLAGRGISNAIGGVVDKVKHSAEVLGQNNDTIRDIAKSGDVQKLLDLEMENDPENPVGGFTNAIFNISKYMNVPVAGIHWVGGKISAKFKEISNKARNSINTLKTNHNQIVAISKSGNFESLNALTMTQDPDNPVGGFTTTIFNLDKLVHYVPTAFHWVGEKVSSVFNSAKDGLGSSFEILQSNHDVIQDYVQAGDVQGLASLAIQTPDNDPAGGFVNAIFTADKFVHVPSAALHWVGGKVRNTYNAVVSTVTDAKDSLDGDIDSIGEKASTGDVAGLSSIVYTPNPGNPLDGIMEGIFNVTKVVNYPRAAVHWVGNKVSEKFDQMSIAINTNRQTLDQENDKLKDYANDGDLASIWNSKLTLQSGDPLGGIWHASFGITKLFQSVVGLFHKVGNFVEDTVEAITDWWDNTIEDLWDKLGELNPFGGGSDSNSARGGVGGPESEVALQENNTSDTVDQTASIVKEGGNPLDKAFHVTSYFGPRKSPYTGTHKGVDLVPADWSGQANVGSRFAGVVEAIKTNVPDSDKAYKGSDGVWRYSGSNDTGNYVNIRTDSGLVVKNYHLKANSIPSTIKPGARVKVGDKLGVMGTTGWSTGNHLHYQIEKDGTPFDPLSSVKGGETIGEFATYGDGTHTTSGSSSSSTSSISSSSTGTGWLARLIDALKGIGSKFLNFISGGLFGESSSSSSSISSGSSSSSASIGTTSYDISQLKVKSLQEFLDMCANEIGTMENPPSSNKVKYNTWYYGSEVSGEAYPWCMAFVQWCFNEAGLTLEYKTASCSALLDWFQKNHPELVTKDPKPGDIIIWTKATSSMSHTGIVEKVISGTQIQTIEGNTSTTSTGDQANGGCVARKTRNRSEVTAYLRAVDFEALEAAVKMVENMKLSPDAEANAFLVYQYLKSKGIPDVNIAGVLGNWTHESGIDSTGVESIYNEPYTMGPRKKAAMADPGTFTQNLFAQYARQGLSINREAYKGDDGIYYPGIGLGGFTGPAATRLMRYVKKYGANWWDLGPQLEYAYVPSSEGGYRDFMSQWTSAESSPSQAARVFLKKWEGINPDIDWVRLDKRQLVAQQYYNKMKGEWKSKLATINTETTGLDEVDAMGGPPEAGDSATYSPSNYTSTNTRRSSRSSTNRITQSRTSTYRSPARTSTSDTLYQPITITNNGEIVRMMYDVLIELRSITKNTGSSSDLLGELNTKEFVDQGLRNSLNSLSVSKNRSSMGRTTQAARTNVRTVTAMARP